MKAVAVNSTTTYLGHDNGVLIYIGFPNPIQVVFRFQEELGPARDCTLADDFGELIIELIINPVWTHA